MLVQRALHVSNLLEAEQLAIVFRPFVAAAAAAVVKIDYRVAQKRLPRFVDFFYLTKQACYSCV